MQRRTRPIDRVQGNIDPGIDSMVKKKSFIQEKKITSVHKNTTIDGLNYIHFEAMDTIRALKFHPGQTSNNLPLQFSFTI